MSVLQNHCLITAFILKEREVFHQDGNTGATQLSYVKVSCFEHVFLECRQASFGHKMS